MQRAVCVRRNTKKNIEKKNEKYAPHPKQTSKSTAARRPRPTRDGVRQNTSQAVAHTRALPPSIPRLWKSASLVHIRTRTAAAAPFVFVLVHDVLASAASAFSIVIPGICLWFRSCPVVLDIELSVSAGYQKTGRALLRASCLVMLLRERRCAVCGITLEIPCISGNKRTIWCQSENEGIPPRPSHTHIKKHFFFWELPVWTCELDPNDR